MSLNWNSVKPACCAKWLVLPTVYSDALSYGEQLDKFCYQLNQLIGNNNILPDFIAEMIKEYINSGAIGEVVRDILAGYILNVKYPPEGITPAVGDGSADDTAAIQGCIDYAAENGGVVYFPYGSYLTQPLTMKDGVSLFGFDRYSTKIVLKGGATKPLIGGTVADFSIANLTLDGNSGIQVNDVNVVTLMATNVLFTNLIIKDGYTLVNYVGTGGHFQIIDVVFGGAVEKCLLTAGNADVQCENILFNQLSAVGGISVMDIGTDGGFFNVKSVATCNQCIVVSGNSNKISAIVENATIPVVDNGLQNNIEIFGVSNKEFYSGDTNKVVNGGYSKHIGGEYTKDVNGGYSKHIGGEYIKDVNGVYSEHIGGEYTKNLDGDANESVGGNFSSIVKGVTTETYNDIRTIKEKNVVESGETKKLNFNDLVLNTTNPIQYKKPDNLSYYFKSIPFKDPSGNTYKVLVQNEPNLIENMGVINALYHGVKGDGVTDDSDSINNMFSTYGQFKAYYFPTGNYLVSKKIVIPNNCLVFGDGGSTTFYCAENYNNTVFEFNTNTTIKDFTASKRGDNGSTFILSAGDYNTIENITIYNFNQAIACKGFNTYLSDILTSSDNKTGLSVIDRCVNLFADNCQFYASNYSVSVAAPVGNLVEGLHFSNCTIGLANTAVLFNSEILVTEFVNCIIDQYTAWGVLCNAKVESLNISNCYIGGINKTASGLGFGNGSLSLCVVSTMFYGNENGLIGLDNNNYIKIIGCHFRDNSTDIGGVLNSSSVVSCDLTSEKSLNILSGTGAVAFTHIGGSKVLPEGFTEVNNF